MALRPPLPRFSTGEEDAQETEPQERSVADVSRDARLEEAADQLVALLPPPQATAQKPLPRIKHGRNEDAAAKLDQAKLDQAAAALVDEFPLPELSLVEKGGVAMRRQVANLAKAPELGVKFAEYLGVKPETIQRHVPNIAEAAQAMDVWGNEVLGREERREPAAFAEQGLASGLARAAGTTIPFFFTGPIGRAAGRAAALRIPGSLGLLAEAGGEAGSAAATALTGGAMAAVPMYEDVLAETGDEQKAWTASWAAWGFGLLEAAGLGRIAAKIDRASAGSLSRALGKMAVESLEEGTQELVQTIGESVSRKWITDKDVRWLQELEQGGQAAGIGALLGGAVSGGIEAAAGTAEKLGGRPAAAARGERGAEMVPPGAQPEPRPEAKPGAQAGKTIEDISRAAREGAPSGAAVLGEEAETHGAAILGRGAPSAEQAGRQREAFVTGPKEGAEEFGRPTKEGEGTGFLGERPGIEEAPRRQPSRKDAAADLERLAQIIGAPDEELAAAKERVSGAKDKAAELEAVRTEWLAEDQDAAARAILAGEEVPLQAMTPEVVERAVQQRFAPAAARPAPSEEEPAQAAPSPAQEGVSEPAGTPAAAGAVPTEVVTPRRRALDLRPEDEEARAELKGLSEAMGEAIAQKHEAEHDALTGLFNRRGDDRWAARVVDTARKSKQRVVRIFADLRDLTSLNNLFGYDLADQIIRESTAAWTSGARETDEWARTGGDEFSGTLIVGPDADPEAIVQRLEAASDAVLKKHGLDKPIQGRVFGVDAGWAEIGADADADAALKEASKAAQEMAKQRKYQRNPQKQKLTGEQYAALGPAARAEREARLKGAAPEETPKPAAQGPIDAGRSALATIREHGFDIASFDDKTSSWVLDDARVSDRARSTGRARTRKAPKAVQDALETFNQLDEATAARLINEPAEPTAEAKASAEPGMESAAPRALPKEKANTIEELRAIAKAKPASTPEGYIARQMLAELGAGPKPPRPHWLPPESTIAPKPAITAAAPKKGLQSEEAKARRAARKKPAEKKGEWGQPIGRVSDPSGTFVLEMRRKGQKVRFFREGKQVGLERPSVAAAVAWYTSKGMDIAPREAPKASAEPGMESAAPRALPKKEDVGLGPLAEKRELARRDGRDRYLDQTPAQRAEALPIVVRDAESGPEDARQFARGWLDALQGRGLTADQRAAAQREADRTGVEVAGQKPTAKKGLQSEEAKARRAARKKPAKQEAEPTVESDVRAAQERIRAIEKRLDVLRKQIEKPRDPRVPPPISSELNAKRAAEMDRLEKERADLLANRATGAPPKKGIQSEEAKAKRAARKKPLEQRAYRDLENEIGRIDKAVARLKAERPSPPDRTVRLRELNVRRSEIQDELRRRGQQEAEKRRLTEKAATAAPIVEAEKVALPPEEIGGEQIPKTEEELPPGLTEVAAFPGGALDPVYRALGRMMQRFRRTPPLQNGPAPFPRQRWTERAVQRFVDYFEPVGRVQRKLVGETRPGQAALPDLEDAYLQETTRRGRTLHGPRGLNWLEKTHQKPVLAAMRANKIGLDELDAFLMARAAKDGNALIAKRNPGNPDLTRYGMSDDEAQAILDAVKNDPRAAAFEDLGQRFDKLHDDVRAIWVETGRKTQAEVDALKREQPHYAPARTDMSDETGKPIQIPSTKRRVGQPFKKALGRESLAEHPLAFAFAQAEQAIVQGEMNKVRLSFLRFANAYADELQDVLKIVPVPMQRVLVNGTVRESFDPFFRGRDDVVVAWDNGKPIAMEIAAPHQDLAVALNQLGPNQVGEVTRLIGMLNRVKGALVTRYRPVFWPRNMIRDAKTSAYLGSEFGVRFSGRVVKDIPKALLTLSGKDVGWNEHLRRWREAGGPISFLGFSEMTQQLDKISKGIKDPAQTSGDKAVEGFKAIKRAMETASDIGENGARFSMFVHLVEDLGFSDARAAAFSKEMQNFERKGLYGNTINAWYLFSNAGFQTTRRFAQALRNPAVRRMVTASLLAAAGWDQLMRILGGDDEDGRSHWDKIPDYEKRGNFIFMYPDGSGRRVTIPAPWAFGAFNYTGEQLSAVLTGHIAPGKFASSVASAWLNAVNPFGEVTGEDGSGVLRALTPDVLKLPFEIATNRDWKGKPFIREPYDPRDPDSATYWPDVNPVAKEAAAWLNRITGGSQYEKGAIDVSPEVLEHVTRYLAAGLPQDVADTIAAINAGFRGELNVRDVPLLKSFLREPSPFASWTEQKDLLHALEAEQKRAADEKRTITREHAGLIREGQAIEKKRRAVERPKGGIPLEDLPEEERRKKLQQLDIEAQRYNQRAREALKKIRP